MNFFLDENFPLAVRALLEKRGDQVFDVRGTEWEGSDDERIFQLAQEKSAILLSTDKDFFHTVTPLHLNHFGAIVIALSQPNSRAITEKFLWALHYLDKTNIHSKCLLLTDNCLYILPGPLKE